MRSLVIGGGINGLSTAWQLARAGLGPVGLVEQYRIGHQRGSSHGKTRITRSAYGSPTYVQLMRQAHQEEWPALEAESGRKLLFRGDGVFWGDGPLEAYATAVEAGAADVLRLTPAEARHRFPTFRFADTEYVLWDRTGGVLSAAAALEALTGACQQRGVKFWEETRVLDIEAGENLQVLTDRGQIDCERLVICAGPWSGPLLERLGLRLPLVPVRQTVGYWSLQADPTSWHYPAFPVWVHLGQTQLHYGLPAFPGQAGIKAALHQTSAAGSDPEAPGEIVESLLLETETFLQQQLSVPLSQRFGAENCFYTNTPTEDFVLTPHPEESRIVIGAGFSGHGFKLGPLTGKILAELLWEIPSSIPAFRSDRDRFAQNVLRVAKIQPML